ncbi:hypothetical protein ACFVVM_00045 [Nocardia sp. NPDC058176]|uniref:hypothetical protein n=1 Tax=Nocardia sp. NPDC058176 TaxID=3346368 RepID=UPI0036DC0B9F
MADMFLVNFGDDEDRARRRAEQAAEQSRLRQRHAEHLVRAAAIDPAAAERVVAAIFHSVDGDGEPCRCGCHPRLAAMHGDGLDCPCTWSEERRVADRRTRWAEWHDSETAQELRRMYERDQQQIQAWLGGQVGVTAEQTTTFAPEQWHGEVDGHSFYFRERHGLWRLELDLRPNGHSAQRVTGFSDSNEPTTEPIPLTEGDIIAEGVESDLGDGPVEHLEFIVRTIRDHLWQHTCDHAGSLFYCPKCGKRISEPSSR